MTINLLAYPDAEAKRLEQVVLALPINACGSIIDHKPERLPKQISRHLLPSKHDPKARRDLDCAISDFLDEVGTARGAPRKNSITPPPHSRRESTAHTRPTGFSVPPPPPPPQQSRHTTAPVNMERERAPYAGAPPVSDSLPSEASLPVKAPMERERQPYVAAPGTGKVYTSDNPNSTPSQAQAPPPPPPLARPERSPPTSHRRPVDPEPDYPTSSHHRGQSFAAASTQPPFRTRRPPSPQFKNFSQSTPDRLPNSSEHGGTIPTSDTGTSRAFSPSSFAASNSAFRPPHLVDREWERGRDRDGDRVKDRDSPFDYPYHHRREHSYDRSCSQSRDPRRYQTAYGSRRSTVSSLDADGRGGQDTFTSPRDAERWDRVVDGDLDGSGSAAGGARVEDWYRGEGRGGTRYYT